MAMSEQGLKRTEGNGHRKTVGVIELIQEINKRNRLSVNISPDVRRGWNALLESVLHANNVYAGYNHLPADQVPHGQLPGIVDGTFPDDTRRFYYVHEALILK